MDGQPVDLERRTHLQDGHLRQYEQQRPAAWTDSINLNFGSSVDNSQDTGNSFANMLLGNYTSASQSNGKFFGTFRFYGLEFYAQDSWKATPRLTLDFGARYAYLGPTFTYGELLQNYFLVDRYDPAKAVRIEAANGPTKGSIIPGSAIRSTAWSRRQWHPIRWRQASQESSLAAFRFCVGRFRQRQDCSARSAGTFFERQRQNNAYFDGLGNPP